MNHESGSHIAVAMEEAARTINAPRSLKEILDAIVATAPGTVPGFDHASVSVAYGKDLVETTAASGDLPTDLDLRQYQTQQGPCYEALTTPGIVMSPSIRTEERWPDYVPHAARAGVTAQMAVHLVSDNGVRGGLNLYSTSGEGIDPDAVGMAQLFATHAALALGRGYSEEQLRDALASRGVIGQAIGVLMERNRIDEATAFNFLTRVSQRSNIKLRDIAIEVVTRTDSRYRAKEPS